MFRVIYINLWGIASVLTSAEIHDFNFKIFDFGIEFGDLNFKVISFLINFIAFGMDFPTQLSQFIITLKLAIEQLQN